LSFVILLEQCPPEIGHLLRGGIGRIGFHPLPHTVQPLSGRRIGGVEREHKGSAPIYVVREAAIWRLEFHGALASGSLRAIASGQQARKIDHSEDE
jgi:hypothetical protein